MVPMELSGTGPLRGMKPRISHTITHPAILMRSCIGMCLYTITLILLHTQNILLSGMAAAAAAAKSLQSCLTLCDPLDGSPPGSPVPGILQARTLEWVAISFSNA